MRARIISTLVLYRYDRLVPDYMFMLTSALILGAWLTVRRCRRHGLAEEDVYQAVFYALLLAFVGGRLVYFLQYSHEFMGQPWELLDPMHGGIALYGGMLGLIAGPALYLRSRRLALGRYFDATVPALAIGLFLGRIGCFLAGCNWGKITSLPWGVRFPPPHHAYAQHLKAGLIERGSALSLPVHPTQLYESLFGLAMFGLTTWWLVRTYPSEPRASASGVVSAQHLPAHSLTVAARIAVFFPRARPGQIFLTAISCYAVFRFLVEFIRADSQGLRLGAITVAQGLSILVFAVCQFFFWRDRRCNLRDIAESRPLP